MILEILEIMGLSASFILAFLFVYLFRYFETYFKDPEEFKRSYDLALMFIVALLLHSIYSLENFYNIPFRPIFEIGSVALFLGMMIVATKRVLIFQISSEARKGSKVNALIELRALKERLNDTSLELIETKNFFSNIVQSSADAIVASDMNKKITYFSKGAEELFEQRAKDLLGTNVLDLYPSEVLRKSDRMTRAKELKKRGHIKNMTMKISLPKGGVKTISLSLSLLKDQRGEVKGTVGVAKDITKEITAADEIRYLKELSDKILEGTPEGLILLDLNFKITMVNQGFENITGISKDLILDKNALEYLKIPQLDKLFETMKLKQKFVEVAYNTKTLEPAEFELKLNKQIRTLSDYWTPLFNADGNVEFILIILQDITARKTLEEDLKEQADRLKQSNDLKDIFADIMRHDLLNPIGVIKNYIELINEEDINPSVLQTTKAILRNVEKAVEMIENASSLSKIESQEEIKFEENDIGIILRDTVNSVKSRAAKKNIVLKTAIKGKYPATINPFIEDVFLNLLTNSIKYGPEGGTVTSGIEDAGDTWKVFVKDQGEGVPDEFKESIFTRFERLKREGVKGSGLGLAIAKRIVEMHKGRIWVEDNQGGGSIFYVELPKK